MHHTCMTDQDWQKIVELRGENAQDSKQKQANSFFLSIRDRFRKNKACSSQISSCTWSLYQGEHEVSY